MAESKKNTDVKVIVDDSKTKVQLILPPLFGNDAMARQICHAKLQEQAVEINQAVIKAVDLLIAQSKTPAPGSPKPGSPELSETQSVRGVVATAQLPEDGIDGKVQWTYKPPTAAEPDPDEAKNKDQARNYYEDSIYNTIEKDVTVGILSDPTPGVDGRDVLGNTLAAKAGKPYELTYDQSIFKDAKGNLITQTQGVLVKANNAICVRQVIEVKGYVDFNTGNIDFSGDVIVHEGIRDCFVVKAQGDITVKGLIEAATIITGNDLHANGGMAGREQGHIEIGNDLHGRYLDNVQGTIQNQLYIEREILNCEITVLGDVASPTGSLIGGHLTVGGKVDLETIGSPAEVRSNLIIGSVPTHDPILEKLTTFIEKLEHKRKKFANEQDMINNNTKNLSAQQKEKQTELMFELMMIDEPLNKARDAHFRVNAKAEASRTVNVTVHKIIHAGTVLTIMGTPHKFRNDMRGSVRLFKDEKNKIVFKQGDGKTRPLASVCDVLPSQ